MEQLSQIRDSDHACFSQNSKDDTVSFNTDDRKPSILIVAAIDFGTTNSGIAWSFTHNHKKYPLQINCKKWDSPGGAGQISEKTPSALLLNSKQEFEAFGYAAEETFSELADDNASHGYYYFKHFKMLLYANEKLTRETTLKDEKGHQLPAKVIFKHCIQFLKNDFLKDLKKRGDLVKEDEILWVLTVPAIWNDAAKQFMREAAEEAGIPRERLKLALEPEAASIYVRETLTQRAVDCTQDVQLEQYRPGTKFVVLDLGGGTVDTTIREVLPDRSLKELHVASGGPWGGMHVNKLFLEFLRDLFKGAVIDELSTYHHSAMLDLEREIETKKRQADGSSGGRVMIKLPSEIPEIYKKLNGKDLNNALAFEETKYAGKMDIKHGRLRLDKSIVNGFYEKAIQRVIEHAQKIMSCPAAQGVTEIILVGGFAESELVRKTIESSFASDTLRVIITDNCGLAVLKGAVIYGHQPNIVKYRASQYTYGTAAHRYFIDGHDPDEKKEIYEGVPYCKDIFNKLAEVGQNFEVGQTVQTEVYALRGNMTKMSIKIFKSTESDPKFITDQSCSWLGKLVVDMKDLHGGANRKVAVSLIFGDTEIMCVAKDDTTGDSVSCTLDMLS